jgi:hypothetical protein
MEKTRNILVYIYACLYYIIFLYIGKYGVTTTNKVTLVCVKKARGIEEEYLCFLLNLDT